MTFDEIVVGLLLTVIVFSGLPIASAFGHWLARKIDPYHDER